MSAPLTPEDLRHLAAIVRAEREVYELTQAAFAAWLPLVEALVLDDVAVVAAVDPQRAGRAQDAWEKAIVPVVSALAALWTLRYKRKGKNAKRMAAALDRFRAATRARLAGVTKGTYESIQSLIAHAQRVGYTEAEIRVALGIQLDPIDYRSKSARISRTSVMSAYNGGAEDGFRDYAKATGATVTKTWHTLLDGKARETHVDANDQTVGLDEPFEVGGFYCQHPGDDTLPAWEAINCRCIATFKSTGGSIVADAGTPTDLAPGWRGPIAALDRLTGDGRWLATPPGGLRTREYPMTVTRGHVGAEKDIFIGTMEAAWIQDGMLWAEGAFDLGGADGAEASRLVSDQLLFTMSIDPDQVTAEQRLVDASGNMAPDAVLEQALNTGVIPEGYSPVMVFTDWRLASVALVSIPAYDEARIEPVFDYVRPAPKAAAPDHSSSSMIALRPTSHAAYDLAVDGGLAPEELHVTLRYLGETAAIEVQHLPTLQRAASDGALALEGMNNARVAGFGMLGDEGAVVLFLNGLTIAQAHQNVQESLADLCDVLPAPHQPFLAHMTLGYGIPLDAAAQFVGYEFAFAGTTFDYGTEITHHSAPVTPVVASVSGSTSLPVADSGRAWDGGGAAGRMLDAATSAKGVISAGKAGRGFLWRDGDGSKRGDYKLPFADIVNGKLTIIPRGVSAAAGRLNQTQGVDKAAIGKKICSLYSKIRKTDATWPDCPIVASAEIVAGVGGQIFKKANFERVATGPTPLSVDEDGAVYGHVRLHGTCYQYGGGQGDGGYCVQPPPSDCGYSKFHVHGAKMDDGSTWAVGAITYGEGHESRGGLMASQRHYNDVATMAAKVVASEDEWGVWVAGEVLDSHREVAYDILLSPMSGHWEPDADNGNYLEMLAAHIVVTPGYHVRRIVASFDDAGNAICIVIPSPWQNRTETGTVLTTKLLSAGDHRRAEALSRRVGIDRDSRAARARGRLGL